MDLLKQLHRPKQETVLIIGCGRLGAMLASMLSEQNKKVTIMDISQAAFRKLSSSYGGFSIEGDGSDLDMLVHAGVIKADVLITCTDDDDVNIMIAQVAKQCFSVAQVIVRIQDSSKKIVLCDLDIRVICPDQLSVDEFQRIMAGRGQGCSS